MSEERSAFGLSPEEHERLGAAFFNEVWSLMETPDRTVEQTDRMVHMAHASRLHWELAGGAPVNLGRGEWQASRVYALVGRAEPALHHAQRCLAVCTANGIGDFDLAFAHEAVARAHGIAGDAEVARRHAALAREASAGITEEDDRELLAADLATLPFS